MATFVRFAIAATGAVVLLAMLGRNEAPRTPAMAEATVDAAIAASWSTASPDWKGRFVQDEVQAKCSAAQDKPDPASAATISKRAAGSIVYPPDGRLIGDWRRGEALAQSGYGLRFTDRDPKRATGGNCYACHQIDRREVSFGTLGPSLTDYGRNRAFRTSEAKAVYDKIFDPHAAQACTSMPRFGANRVLSIDEIKDLVALLMDPASPVNQ